MERAKRAANWISAGFALLFASTLLALMLAPSLSALFPESILQSNTLFAVFLGVAGPMSFAWGLHQRGEGRLLPEKPWTAWIWVIALAAFGTHQYTSVFIGVLDLNPTAFGAGNAPQELLLMVYWGSFTVFVSAMLALVWKMKPSGIPRIK